MLSALAFLLAVDFGTQVHPILTAKCMGCHSARMAQGGLALETRAQVLKVVTPGNPISPGCCRRLTTIPSKGANNNVSAR